MIKCIECNKEFEPKHFNEKVCSEKCRLIRLKKIKCASRMKCKEHIKISGHNWYLKHKKDKLQQNKNWREKHPERMRELIQKWRKKNRLEILSILGDSCRVCGSKQTIQFHEIHGKKHRMDIIYVRNNIADFVSLCGKCHRAKTRLNQLNEEQKDKLMTI